MEENNQLSDIILNQGKKGSNLKKIILGSAFLIVLFVAVVFIVKAVNAKKEKKVELIPQTESHALTEPQKVVEPRYEQVPILQEEQGQQLDRITEEIKQKAQSEEPKPLAKQQDKTPPQAATPAPAKQPVASAEPQNNTSFIPSGYYIQVGAFFRSTPDESLIMKIKSKGLQYKIQKSSRNKKDIIKVLVGPFKSQSEAKESLSEVRKSINKDAFIIKV